MNPTENIRLLAAEIVEKAQSGHPGAPMGLATVMYTLYTEYLVLDPSDPRNPDRDIFVLSNGHACLIQYISNHLLGFLSKEDLLNYRQLNSLCPGHPERNERGIEISTGPLGQGVAASVGFAISSKLFSKYCRKSDEPNRVFCIFGDGCYQEGIGQEAFSLCSKFRLDNITFIYDYNKNTIDGPTTLSMNEDVPARFRALDFTVVECDGEDVEGIRKALAMRPTNPLLIILSTETGKDSELEGDCKSHGAPLGEENVKKLRQKYNSVDGEFFISEELKEAYKTGAKRMAEAIRRRNQKGDRADHINNVYDESQGNITYDTDYKFGDQPTRRHIFKALNEIKTKQLLISGCADLTTSTLSHIESAVDFECSDGLNVFLRFGIREHAMVAVMNGIAAHGRFVPICGTFLNFISYGYPAVRLACLDRLKTIYMLSHDSILLGGDGPTHQPVEVLATLRATSGLIVLRPCDGRESRAALITALKEPGPVALIVSRQNMSDIKETEKEEQVHRGAYFLRKADNHEIILYATGSEVELAFKAADILRDRRISIVSFVSFELFERQSEAYKKSILDRSTTRISIEALSTFGWSKYSDFQIGLDEYGRSAPGADVYEYFGFTPEAVASKVRGFAAKSKDAHIKDTSE